MRCALQLLAIAPTLLTPSAPLLAGEVVEAPDSPPAHMRTVRIEPSRAKGVPGIRITLSAEPMEQTPFGYASTYSVRVFPLFFFNESGYIRIFLDEEALERLGKGKAITFTGEALTRDDDRRQLEGRAEPVDARSGSIRIVVKIGSIDLIFDTTYRFVGDERDAASSTS